MSLSPARIDGPVAVAPSHAHWITDELMNAVLIVLAAAVLVALGLTIGTRLDSRTHIRDTNFTTTRTTTAPNVGALGGGTVLHRGGNQP